MVGPAQKKNKRKIDKPQKWKELPPPLKTNHKKKIYTAAAAVSELIWLFFGRFDPRRRLYY